MSILRKSLPALVLLVLGVLLAFQLVPQELEQMKYEVPGMPETYPIEQKCRPVFLLLLCMLPFILLFNLIKAGVNGAVTFFIYKSISGLITKVGAK